MDSFSGDKALVDNTNVPKSSEQPIQRKRRHSENDSLVKLSETTNNTTLKTLEELDGVSTTTESESTLTRLVLSPALFFSYLISLYVVDKRERTISISTDGTRYHEKHTRQAVVTRRDYKKWIKSELLSAFDMRKKIMTILVILSLLLLIVISWALSKLYILR